MTAVASAGLAVGLAALHLLTGPTHATAQLVRGEVTEAAGGAPLRGAFVSALDRDGTQVGAVLTDRDGTFRLRLPAGSFRLRVERIGFESVTTEPFSVAAEEVVQRSFPLRSRAISLEGITAVGEQRCVLRPEEGLAIHALWDEARKALEISSFVESGRLYRFRTEVWMRELDPLARTVVRDIDQRVRTGYASPFESLPAEELVGSGFAVEAEDGDGWILYAPDAEALLSDPFLDTHCFRVVENAHDRTLVGLSFEPVPGRRVPDVRGVLWLDRVTGELRNLEYAYVNVPLPPEHLGGRVEFDRLDSGAWIVQRWWIRSPVVVAEQTGEGLRMETTRRIAAIRESGGEVNAIFTPSGSRIEAPAGVTGVVFDSIAGAPLEGATVFLNGTQYTAVTDGEGRFEIAGPRPGRYSVGFTHPRLRELRAVPPLREVEVSRGANARVLLATPSLPSIAEAACARAGIDGGRAVGGVVRNAETGVPLAGAEVTVEWRGPDGPGRLEAEADVGGVYRICGAPENLTLRIHARVLSFSGDAETLEPAAAGAGAHLDLPIRLTQAVAQGLGLAVVSGEGQIRVEGRLLDADGAPVADARVHVRAASLQAVTGSDGRFLLRSLSPGVHRLEIEHASFESFTEEIALGGGRVADLEITLPFRVERPRRP